MGAVNIEFKNGEIEKQSGELKANLTIPFPSPAVGTVETQNQL